MTATVFLAPDAGWYRMTMRDRARLLVQEYAVAADEARQLARRPSFPAALLPAQRPAHEWS